MSDITVRYADTQYGDTIQAIALREMGHASFWHTLVLLNDLIPPFVTDNPDLASDRVLLTGEKIALPTAGYGLDPDEIETFGTDVALDRFGDLTVAGGDVVSISGFQNLKFALIRRVIISKRSMQFHPGYGCWVDTLRGEKLGSAQLALAAFYVKSSLLEDDRVKEVLSCVATADGDSISIAATIQPIDGKDLTLEVII